MKIHEYQAKSIFRDHGLPLPEGIMAESVDDAIEATKKIGTFPVVIKAQVHVGGRSKAGGVKLAADLAEVKLYASSILGMNIKGITVRKLLVEAGVDIHRELYTAIIVDRASKCPVLMVSASGGVDIEEVAASDPDRILKLKLDPALGIQAYQMRQAAFFLDIPKDALKSFSRILQTLEKVLSESDASLVEINPLVLTSKNEIMVCDAKINLDDNALPLHSDLAEFRDPNEEDPMEAEARQFGLSYVKLDGKIGCLVNGAGLAMGTMDIVKHCGGEPANFLDVGGEANADTIAEALRIITSDPGVKVVFFNIFGGIVRCDRVAEGVLKARAKMGLNIPVVMRLVGTNEERAHDLLEGTDLLMLPTMVEAARKAVELCKPQE
jgi:succinyl-CoA synthetase beta subunit